MCTWTCVLFQISLAFVTIQCISSIRMYIFQVFCDTRWTFKVCSWTTSKLIALIWTTTKSHDSTVTFRSLKFSEGEDLRVYSCSLSRNVSGEQHRWTNAKFIIRCSMYDIITKLLSRIIIEHQADRTRNTRKKKRKGN